MINVLAQKLLVEFYYSDQIVRLSYSVVSCPLYVPTTEISILIHTSRSNTVLIKLQVQNNIVTHLAKICASVDIIFVPETTLDRQHIFNV